MGEMPGIKPGTFNRWEYNMVEMPEIEPRTFLWLRCQGLNLGPFADENMTWCRCLGLNLGLFTAVRPPPPCLLLNQTESNKSAPPIFFHKSRKKGKLCWFAMTRIYLYLMIFLNLAFHGLTYRLYSAVYTLKLIILHYGIVYWLAIIIDIHYKNSVHSDLVMYIIFFVLPV